jgi:spermidine synthase
VKPWTVLARTRTSNGTELTLTHHPSEFAILADGQSLMTSRMHASEDALAILGCRYARALECPSVLVGGLGMGFTLRAALDVLPHAARVVVAELVPTVVEWNRGPLAALANHPLDDPRVTVESGDVAEVLRSSPGCFDAVLLDVDNGPDAMTAPTNAGLYDARGIGIVREALREGGMLAVWSARDDRQFARRLRAAGFTVQREHPAARPNKRGARHTILLGHKT